MNPLNWKKEHKIALAITMFTSATVSIILGFFVYAITSGADGSLAFSYWLESPIRNGIYKWAIFGCVISYAVVVAKRLFSE
jgi:hypothetical protein